MSEKKGWKLGVDSETKLIVWFKDGNVRTMYSLDWKHKFSKVKDRNLGITRLRTLIKKYGPLAGTAEIYDKATGQRIARFYQGLEQNINEQTY